MSSFRCHKSALDTSLATHGPPLCSHARPSTPFKLTAAVQNSTTASPPVITPLGSALPHSCDTTCRTWGPPICKCEVPRLCTLCQHVANSTELYPRDNWEQPSPTKPHQSRPITRPAAPPVASSTSPRQARTGLRKTPRSPQGSLTSSPLCTFPVPQRGMYTEEMRWGCSPAGVARAALCRRQPCPRVRCETFPHWPDRWRVGRTTIYLHLTASVANRLRCGHWRHGMSRCRRRLNLTTSCGYQIAPAGSCGGVGPRPIKVATSALFFCAPGAREEVRPPPPPPPHGGSI